MKYMENELIICTKLKKTYKLLNIICSNPHDWSQLEFEKESLFQNLIDSQKMLSTPWQERSMDKYIHYL